MKIESETWKTSLLRIVKLFALLYLFFLSIELLSGSFKIFGLSYEEEFKRLIAVTAHPLVGLCLGLLITSVIQSSSTTTSMLVAAVAEGSLPVPYAIPMIMGANIGTTVTGVIVAMGHITRRQEFQKAYAAATIHDYFNFLSVLIILPLEVYTHFLERTCTWLTSVFVGVGGVKVANPLKDSSYAPAKHFFEGLIYQVVEKGSLWAPPLMLLVALIILAFALKYLSSTIKSAITGRVEKLVNGYLFARAWRALLLGAL